MTSVQSVTCCCLLWLMLSVQPITPGSPGPAQLSRERSFKFLSGGFKEIVCHRYCAKGIAKEFCNCPDKRDVVSPRIRRRKRSKAM
uniref:Scratcher peptide n=1 Tax=Conus geographus TaxID=6491 RepID=CJST_CONGE|nr:RecName: Full=Scratcher peptide; Flags: Precursor [Conus geographus]BAO65601.1 G068_VD_Superfamily_J_precursor_conopeptide [Conus geographus]